MQSLKRKPETAQSFDLIKNEVEKKFKPNYDNKFGLENSYTVNNDYSEVEKSNHTRYFQKWRFKNRARFKRSLVSVFTLFVVSFASCGASDKPTEPDRLPFGVFPLNDVKWVHITSYMLEHSGANNYIVEHWYDTIIYSVRQTGENQADLYISGMITLKREGWEWDSTGFYELEFEDSTRSYGPILHSRIYLENKKVYCQIGDNKDLLYDFNLRLNDIISIGHPAEHKFEYFVDSTDSVLVGSEYRKRYHFKPVISGHYPFYVIEGIGSGSALLYPFYKGIEISHLGIYGASLRGVYYKDKLIWGYDILGNKGE